LQTDPLLPSHLRPRWRRCLDGPVHFVTSSLALSLAAWLGSMPLVACYFHLFTPISLLANLVVVPLGSLALMSNLGSLLCGGRGLPPMANSSKRHAHHRSSAQRRRFDLRRCARANG